MLVGRSVAHAPGIVSGGCGRAGVEEVMGFAGSSWGPAGSGMGMLLGSRTATRDVWSRAVFRMSPWGGRPAGVPCPDRFLGAWWFENWIVDASNAMIVSSFALSRFRQASSFGVWFRDRSFCDHFFTV